MESEIEGILEKEERSIKRISSRIRTKRRYKVAVDRKQYAIIGHLRDI